MALSPGLYEEIQQEAYARSRRWQADQMKRGSASAGWAPPQCHFDWWVTQVALERGMNWTEADANREADFVMDMTDKQILDDARWRGECPDCKAREFDDILARGLTT